MWPLQPLWHPYLLLLVCFFCSTASLCECRQWVSSLAPLSVVRGAVAAGARDIPPAASAAAVASSEWRASHKRFLAFVSGASPRRRQRCWLPLFSQRQQRTNGHPLTGLLQQRPLQPEQQQQRPLQQQQRPLQHQPLQPRTSRPFLHMARRGTGDRLGVGALQMNAAPPGSALERQMSELMQDPIKNMPVCLSPSRFLAVALHCLVPPLPLSLVTCCLLFIAAYLHGCSCFFLPRLCCCCDSVGYLCSFLQAIRARDGQQLAPFPARQLDVHRVQNIRRKARRQVLFLSDARTWACMYKCVIYVCVRGCFYLYVCIYMYVHLCACACLWNMYARSTVLAKLRKGLFHSSGCLL